MSAHTPGPWEVEGDQIVTTDAGIPICSTPLADEIAWGGPDLINEVEANARLIAAAPDLLATVKLLIERACPHPDEMTPEEYAALESARAAIAKAEGGT